MEFFGKRLVPWIGKTAKMLDYFQTQKLKEFGFDLTKEQWVVLKVLSHNNGASQNEIACLTNRDKASMTRLVNIMERKNYIARIPSKEDKRINLLYLTKQGESILNDTELVGEKMIEDLQQGVTDEEIAVVINVMKKIQNNIDKDDSWTCN